MTSMENKPGYKKTKLGWIPDKWEIVSLKDSCKKKISYGIVQAGPHIESGMPYIKSTDLNNQIKASQLQRTSDEIAAKYHRSEVVPGDIVFSLRGNIGVSQILPDDIKVANLTQGTARISVSETMNNVFVYYYLNSDIVKSRIYAVKKGSTFQEISLSELRKTRIAKPHLLEQQKIAAILSTWDKAIDKLSALLDAKEEQKKGLMQRLLSGKVRLKGFDMEWQERKLGEVFSERKETRREGLELLSIGSKGVYPQSESNKKDTSNSNKDKYKRICKGDIGYNTMRMWQGRSAVSSIEGIVSPAYTIVTPKEGHNVNFFGYLFHTPDLIHRFWRFSQGLVGDTLNCKFNSFSKVKVLVPTTTEEQKEIAAVLDQISLEIKTLEKKRDIYELEKKGLMQQLLTGKTRVKTAK